MTHPPLARLPCRWRGGLRLALALALTLVLTLALFDAMAAERPPTASPAGAATGAAAQGPLPAGRPKIGLVLSGGGARGAAHVGVLKVLESMRVPIDYIAGTSMGSIVGGAYASGTSVAEMEAVLGKLSTAALLLDRPERIDQPIRRRRDDLPPFIGPEVGVRGGTLRLPSGAVSGVALEAVLRRLVRTSGVVLFDRLPIPFHAMATDIENGDHVVLVRGDLAGAMRASMAVPGLVAPAEIDGRLLIDGGLTRNLPVDAVRAMGADIVIAVNLGTPLLRRDQIDSLLGVSVQMLNILTEQNVRTSLAELRPQDILIEPALGDYSAGDFDNMEKTVPIGEAAARKVATRLQALALPAQAYAALRAAQSVPAVVDRRPIDEIRVEGVSRVNPAVVIDALETRVGEPVDPGVLDADLRRVFGRGEFESVRYSLLDEPGRRILSIRAPEKSWGPGYLRFGLGLSSDLQGESYFNFLGSYRREWVNALGAEWRTDLQLGGDNRLVSEFYQPLSVDQSLFLAPRIEAGRRPVPLYRGDVRLGRFDETVQRVALDVGSQFGRYGEGRVGILRGERRLSIDTGAIALPPGTSPFEEGAVTARVLIDRLDSVRFSRSGYSGVMNLFGSRTALGADADYTRFDIDLLAARSFGAHTLQFGVRSSGAVGSSPLPLTDLVQWGGFQQQSGYRAGQLLGRSLDYGRVTYLNQFIKRGLLEGAYLGASLEAGRVGGSLFPESPQGHLLSGSMFIAMDTLLGPVYLAWGHARDGSSSLYLYLGRP
jgi:NTE family protein